MDQGTYGYLQGLGATDDQIRNSYARYMQNNPPQQPQQSGNWFTHLLPTIGGVAGGLVTAPLEALDAVTGLGGTALNVAGASGGSALGKMLENTLEGTGDHGVGGAALEGAGGQVLGGIGGKILGGFGSKIAGGLSDAAGNIADRNAAQAAADRLSAFSNVPAKIRQTNNLNPVADLMDTVGVAHTPSAYQNAAAAVTGENGAVNGIKNQLISQAGPVDMSGVMDQVDSAIKPNILLGDITKKGTAANNLRKYISDELQQNVFNGQGTLTNQADPNDIFDLIKRVGTLKNGLGQGEQSDALGNAYGGIQKALENPLYKNAGADKLAAGYKVTPDDLMAISKATGGNPQLTAHIVDGLNNAKSISEIRRLEAPFVQASTLGRAADRVAAGEIPAAPTGSANGVGSDAALAMAPATHGFSLATLLPKALKSEGFVTGANNAVQGASALASKVPAPLMDAIKDIPGQTIAHAPDFATPQAAMSGVAQSSLPTTPGTSPTDNTGYDSQGNSTASAPSPDAPGPSGFTDSQLQQMLDADLQTGGQHSSTIQGLMKMNQAGEKAANPPLSAVTKRLYSQASAAEARLNDFQGLMDKVVNQSGPGAMLTGLARSAAGAANLDTNAKNFNETRSEMALSIARALSGGNTQGSEAMLKRIEGYIPQITDSKESAQNKMAMLHQMLADTRQSILAAPDYGSPAASGSFAADPSQVSFAQ